MRNTNETEEGVCVCIGVAGETHYMRIKHAYFLNNISFICMRY